MIKRERVTDVDQREMVGSADGRKNVSLVFAFAVWNNCHCLVELCYFNFFRIWKHFHVQAVVRITTAFYSYMMQK